MTTLDWDETSEVVRAARQVAGTLTDAGHEALWVGGCVRDRLLGLPPKDIDIATDATPDQVRHLFPKNHHAVGAHFGVILVRQGDVHTEVATFRTEGEYRDARHPDSVAFGSREDDARRRDFTINALYYDPATDRLIDAVGGRDDLDARLLRAIGDPHKRFREDALRLMRAVRFAARFDLAIEPETWDAIRENALRIEKISPERIREELVRIVTGPNRGNALRLLSGSDLLSHILPELAEMKNTPQPEQFHPEGDVFEHTVLALEALPEAPSPSLAMGALLHDVGKPATIKFADRIRFNRHHSVGARVADEICRRLRFSNAERERIVALVAHHMEFMNVREMRPARLRRMLAMDGFGDHLELHRADCLASHGGLDNYDFCSEKLAELEAEAEGPSLPDPLISGDDLIVAGYRPGPRMGEILEAVREAQLDGELATRDDALEWARQRYDTDQA